MSTAIAAPRAAPAEVPRTYGSASGLRSRPWNVTPATASASPTSIAVRTRGRRRSMTIVSAAALYSRPRSMPRRRCARIATVSAGSIDTDPKPTPSTSATARAASPPPASSSGRPRMPAARPRARCVCVIDSPRVVTTVRRRGPGKRRTPQLGGRARGPRRWCASVCLPFLSKVRASNHGIGDRTCALEGRPP